MVCGTAEPIAATGCSGLGAAVEGAASTGPAVPSPDSSSPVPLSASGTIGADSSAMGSKDGDDCDSWGACNACGANGAAPGAAIAPLSSANTNGSCRTCRRIRAAATRWNSRPSSDSNRSALLWTWARRLRCSRFRQAGEQVLASLLPLKESLQTWQVLRFLAGIFYFVTWFLSYTYDLLRKYIVQYQV